MFDKRRFEQWYSEYELLLRENYIMYTERMGKNSRFSYTQFVHSTYRNYTGLMHKYHVMNINKN